MPSTSRLNKLLKVITKASKKRYQAIGEIWNYKYQAACGSKDVAQSPSVLAKIKEAENRIAFRTKQFNEAYEKLISAGIPIDYIEERLFYNVSEFGGGRPIPKDFYSKEQEDENQHDDQDV